MSKQQVNTFGQPVGPTLDDWQACPFPDVATLTGRWCRIEPLLDHHAHELYEQLCGADDASLWTYLSVGPFTTRSDFADTVDAWVGDNSTVSVALLDGDGVACGIAHLMNIRPEHGVMEIGGIVLGRRLQRTTAATEAQFLLARHAFSLGYRRYEWKCDSLNEPSRRAAERLGFTYEGRFRQGVVYKGRSRDTDWFSITDAEWPAVASAYDAWLEPANHFEGRQHSSLAGLRART